MARFRHSLSMRRCLFWPLLLLAADLRAATYSVATAAEFNALPALAAGDVVMLQSGTYGALNKTLVSTISDDATALASPILVLAAEPGAVDVAAPSQITLQGRGITLAGLDFIAGSGMRDNGSGNPAWIIATAADSRFMRISNVRFLQCDAGDAYGHWIFCEGFHHTIEHCSFEGKDEPVANATVAFKRNTSEAGIATPRGHVLRGCYFGPRDCSVSDNGYETIRIGDSSSQAHDMRVTIEGNVFYRAVWRSDGQKPNDMEIVSNKSKGNRIAHNTFLESYGQLTLRHGDACIVEGNYIFGGGTYSGSTIALNAANPHQGGIRIVGQDHVVRNNYLVNLAGADLRAALCLMAGAATWTDGNGSGGNNGYETASNAQIYHNTFIACRAISLGYVDTGSRQPTGVMIYNNAWQGSGTSNGIVRHSAFTPAGSGGNYLYHPSGGSSLGWTGLGGTYTSAFSPQIVEDFDGYKIPSATSPLLDAADATLAATHDVRGLPRPATAGDIGCSEREVAGSGRRPLLRSDVGPVFDGGPAGTYPGAIPPEPRLTVARNGALLQLTVQSVPGRTYRLQRTDGLAPVDWQPFAGPVAGTGTPLVFDDPDWSLFPARFYRVLIEP